ncbi:uridylate-specific endoribonuclease-like [Diadema setosum]|uniref:uridylate-specific endoribonuclease-like n=1 Tax=Diadema setosum TaxID=31175 RepID=UPI003B3A88DA
MTGPTRSSRLLQRKMWIKAGSKAVLATRPRDPISTREISHLAREIWVADVNRVPGSLYALSRQTKISRIYHYRDRSPRRLFTSLEPSILDGETYATLRALLNNYHRSVGVEENTTTRENQEIEAFLDAILNTDVMRLTYDFLFRKGYFSTPSAFRDYLKSTWFDLYARSKGQRVLDSSAFEHTFVGEIKNGRVTGFHNWLQFYLQELAGNLNYYGYTKTSQPNQILLQFNWHSRVKVMSSVMVGVSPEFEMALFTVCFIAQPGQMCSFNLNRNRVSVRTFVHGGTKLGAAYFHVH